MEKCFEIYIARPGTSLEGDTDSEIRSKFSSAAGSIRSGRRARAMS